MKTLREGRDKKGLRKAAVDCGGDIAANVAAMEAAGKRETADFMVSPIFGPHDRPSSSQDVEDINLTHFGPDRPRPSGTEKAIAALQATVSTQSVRAVVGATPTPADGSFAANTASRVGAPVAPADATTTPSWAAAPISPISASLLAADDYMLRKAELRAAADAQINGAVIKALAARGRVAKAAPRTQIAARIIKTT